MSKKVIITIIKPVLRKPVANNGVMTIRDLVNERPLPSTTKNPMPGIDRAVEEEMQEYPISRKSRSLSKLSSNMNQE